MPLAGRWRARERRVSGEAQLTWCTGPPTDGEDKDEAVVEVSGPLPPVTLRLVGRRCNPDSDGQRAITIDPRGTREFRSSQLYETVCSLQWPFGCTYVFTCANSFCLSNHTACHLVPSMTTRWRHHQSVQGPLLCMDTAGAGVIFPSPHRRRRLGYS